MCHFRENLPTLPTGRQAQAGGNPEPTFYILKLQSGSLYIGATTDLEKRYQEHYSGKACRTTILDPPAGTVYSEEFDTFSEARQPEAQVKRWSRAKKEALVSGNLATLQILAKSK